jgi:hypothetical protein
MTAVSLAALAFRLISSTLRTREAGSLSFGEL